MSPFHVPPMQDLRTVDKIAVVSMAHHSTKLGLCLFLAILEFKNNTIWQVLHALAAVYSARVVSIQGEFHGASAAGEGKLFAVTKGMRVVS